MRGNAGTGYTNEHVVCGKGRRREKRKREARAEWLWQLHLVCLSLAPTSAGLTRTTMAGLCVLWLPASTQTGSKTAQADAKAVINTRSFFEFAAFAERLPQSRNGLSSVRDHLSRVDCWDYRPGFLLFLLPRALSGRPLGPHIMIYLSSALHLKVAGRRQ